MLFPTSFSLPVMSLTALLLSSTLTSSSSLVSALRNPSASSHHSNSRDLRRGHAHAHHGVAFDQIKRQPTSRSDHEGASGSELSARGAGPTAEEMYQLALKREVEKRGGDASAAVDGFKKRVAGSGKYVKKSKMMRKRDGTTCKIRTSNAANLAAAAANGTASATESTWTASSSDSWTSVSSSAAWTTSTSSSDTWTAVASATASVNIGQSALTQNGGTSGLLYIDDPTCGNSNPTAEFPNGDPSWLTCGINNNGWTPPNISVAEVIGVSLSSVKDGVFAPCASYIDWFVEIGEKYGIPGVALASIAMQESGCNAAAIGPNQEVGLMQVTPGNCNNMNLNCWDYYGNIDAGAQVFKTYLDNANGNMLLAMGNYNGWTGEGQSGTATTAWRTQAFCPCSQQQNLDYLNSFFNGWLQGTTVATTWNNVDNCKKNNQC